MAYPRNNSPPGHLTFSTVSLLLWPSAPTTTPSRRSCPHTNGKPCSALALPLPAFSSTPQSPLIRLNWLFSLIKGFSPSTSMYCIVNLSDSSWFHFLVYEPQALSRSFQWYSHEPPLWLLTSVLWTMCLSRAQLQLDFFIPIYSLLGPVKGLPTMWLLIPWQRLLSILRWDQTMRLLPLIILIFIRFPFHTLANPHISLSSLQSHSYTSTLNRWKIPSFK